MPKLPGLGQKDAVRALHKAGFSIIRQGKHIVMSDGARTVTIPRHTTINALTMGKIAKEAGYTPEQFRALL
jgi:predicted RNA binding protein YcfA (HicA-like mRNA interferase family)